ncbi:hypothetical protein B0H13DRAFT_2260968 [Mycena leptocephala]|nr:hypothetical protein B0H13DRAFT_2260968 [Mycena leptocephala]
MVYSQSAILRQRPACHCAVEALLKREGKGVDEIEAGFDAVEEILGLSEDLPKLRNFQWTCSKGSQDRDDFASLIRSNWLVDWRDAQGPELHLAAESTLRGAESYSRKSSPEHQPYAAVGYSKPKFCKSGFEVREDKCRVDFSTNRAEVSELTVEGRARGTYGAWLYQKPERSKKMGWR